MRSEARAVVIGGGVVGVSVLYHLAKIGWTDVVLLEKSELTSGSTWHAAGGMHTFNGDANVSRLQKYTIDLYRELETLSGQSCGLHPNGGLMLAANQGEMDSLHLIRSRARYLGMETEIISVAEAKALNCLIEERFLHRRAVAVRRRPLRSLRHHPGLCGLARASWAPRSTGSRACCRCLLEPAAGPLAGRGDRQGHASTPSMWSIAAASGHARSADMVGLEPAGAGDGASLHRDRGAARARRSRQGDREHHRLFGRDLCAAGRQGRPARYLRAGLRPWAPETHARRFLDAVAAGRLRPHRARSWRSASSISPPWAGRVSRRRSTDPFTFAPDGNPLVGPVRGIPNYWVACAVMAGFSQGGGIGLVLSRWMAEGDPGADVLAMDVARFGAFATPTLHHHSRWWRTTGAASASPSPTRNCPRRARPRGAPGIYDRLIAAGGRDGGQFRPRTRAVVRATRNVAAGSETPTYRRSEAFPHVKAECLAVQRSASASTRPRTTAKYEIAGRGARGWLDRVLACRIPNPGRMALAPMLNPAGRLVGDLTVACLAPERFMLTGSGFAEEFHMRWFADNDAGRPMCTIAQSLPPRSAASRWPAPQARTLLQRLVRDDLSAERL